MGRERPFEIILLTKCALNVEAVIFINLSLIYIQTFWSLKVFLIVFFKLLIV